MASTSLRRSLIVGTLFTRRSRAATRFLAAIVGAVLAISLSGLFGLIGFVTHVGEQGRARDFGEFRDNGCVQGEFRYDPYELGQYEKTLLAASCDNPPIPPGLQQFPAPGEVYVSPALDKLRSTDTGIATRIPDVDGIIAASGLTGSNELRYVAGIEPSTGPLPVGRVAFDDFGSNNDYLANYLRFNRITFTAVGLFFTLLPSMYLIAACTRVNARTRERQLGLLAVMGLDAQSLRRALIVEAALTTGAGALLGVLTARPLLSNLTPTFVAWKAFRGGLTPSWVTLAIVFALIVTVAIVASSLAARSLARRDTHPTVRTTWSRQWRWGIFVAGILAGSLTGWWHTDAAWPLVLGGRLATFIGLIVVTPLASASVGDRLVASPDPITSLVGARLRHPSRSLTRALSALAAGLFVLSAGATTVSSLGEDPGAIQAGYSIDGYNVIEVRRPSDETRQHLATYDVLSGTNESTDPDIAGTLTGTCSALRNTVGAAVSCDQATIFATTYEGQTAPGAGQASAVPLFGPRAETLSGFVINITTDSSALGNTDDDIFIPLPIGQAQDLYDQLVGNDYTTNIRIAGAADVSGASELTAILDIFRWGAGFAVTISLLATLVSLIALLYDRQSGNNYLQILGITRRQAALAALSEVGAAAGVTVAISLFSSWLWALSFSITADNQSIGIFALSWPFAAALAGLIILAALMVATTLRNAGTSVVPDRDGLVTAHDVFTLG